MDKNSRFSARSRIGIDYLIPRLPPEIPCRLLTSVDFFTLLSLRVKFCGISEGVRTSDSRGMCSGVGWAGAAVPLSPVHPVARTSEQTRIALNKPRELLICYDHFGSYKNMSILFPAVCCTDQLRYYEQTISVFWRNEHELIGFTHKP